MSKSVANKAKAGKPHRWQKGQSGNPAGRPKDGESWAAIIKAVGDMYPADILAFVGANNDLGKVLAQLPQAVQMKYLVTARVFAALMFEPSSGLWKELMERAEGKVQDHVDITSDGEKITEIGVKFVDYRAGITEAESGPGGDSGASGKDKSSLDGSPLG